MSFKSNQSSDLRRREVEAIWRRRLESAWERYHAAADEYGKLLEPGGCPPGELNRMLRAEADARKEHSRILRIFTNLVMDGKLPEETDEATRDAGAITRAEK